MTMLCTRCKKRMAVVFMSHIEGNETINEGLCISCAKELGIKPVTDMVDKLGISDSELDAISNSMMEMMSDDDENDFEFGGAQTSSFLKDLFGGDKNESNSEKDETEIEYITEGDDDSDDSNSSDEHHRFRKHEKKNVRKFKFLDAHCENLTQKAKEGKIDRIIGRDKEIYRVMQILNRRTKNNPCLIGEPGVGKTAVAEGIALCLASGDVPPKLQDKELYLLDLTSLVAGTQFRGQFEGRVKGLVNDIKNAKNVIIFIDEVHNLVGAGDSEGSMNAANILKPALSRGEIQVIGATTFTEYRKHIEKDAALERRFQPVKINEPNIADTIEVINGIKSYYEEFHRVTVSPEIAKLSVILSERYITDRFLPDKAIDLLDEACSCATLRNHELYEYDKLASQLKEKQEFIEKSEQNSENIDYEKLAEAKATSLQLTAKMEELEPTALHLAVTEADIAKVVELWTGIPASKIQETEMKRVSYLADNLRKKIVGQDEAVDLVSSAVKRSRVQISGRRRPSSFIFV
ncbi:MAG: ATP-dependent Clp protease ATP-binding subunit, partial [Oscillospiraceae bacterium]